MFYTFSKPSYDQQQLQRYWQQINAQDAVLFWQDGIWALLKYAPQLSACPATIYLLENDLTARNLTVEQFAPHLAVQVINLTEWVRLTERYSPQLAL